MKKIILLASALFIFGQVAFAQQRGPQSNKNRAEWIETKVDRMDDALDLSDAQEKKLTKVYKKYLDNNEKITDEQRTEMRAEVRKILTPAQQQKMDAMRKQRQCPHQGNGTCPHQRQHQNCQHNH